MTGEPVTRRCRRLAPALSMMLCLAVVPDAANAALSAGCVTLNTTPLYNHNNGTALGDQQSGATVPSASYTLGEQVVFDVSGNSGAGGNGFLQLDVAINGGPYTVPLPHNYGTKQTYSIAATGLYQFLPYNGSGFATNSSYTYLLYCQEPIALTALTGGTVNSAYSQQVTASAGVGPYTFAVTAGSLPATLSLAADGTLSGTLPTTAGTLNFTVTATDTGTNIAGTTLTGSRAYALAVGPGPATHFAVAAPANAMAGAAFSFTVTALDQFNNTATGYSGQVHFTTSDPQAVLPADTTLSNGVGTLSATLDTAGNQTITATDAGSVSITGTSNAVTVGAAAATHFAVSAPATTASGSPFSFTVTALDAFGNTAPSYAGTVHFSSSDAQATLPADATLTNGVGTFGATLRTGGPQTVSATDTANSTITGTSSPIAISSGIASHFLVSAPANATAGSALLVTVTALDPANNVAISYPGTVHFSTTDGQAVLPADSTLSNGTGTFPATLKTAGNQTITATDTANGSITGTSNTIAVGAGAATHFSVSAPGSATAGTAFSFAVTALDAFNNTASGYAGSAHFTASDGQAVLPADSTLSNGTGTFPATLKTTGSQTITATDAGNAAITGTSGAITVGAGTATHFSLSAPANATAGAAFLFGVTALDAFNNTATSYAGTVHFTASDGQAVLPADSTLASGTATFSATLKTAGNRTITASDAANSLITGTSGAIAVGAAATSAFTVSAPASAVAGSSFAFAVAAKDAFGNATAGYAGTVQFSSSDGAATLPANATLSNGAGTFAATLRSAGSQTITATDTANGAISGTSGSIDVSQAVSTVVIAVAPNSAAANDPVTVTVTVTGVAPTGFVTVFIGGNAIAGCTNLPLVNGSATCKTSFPVAGQYSLTASYGGDANNAPATSSVASVTIGAARPVPVLDRRAELLIALLFVAIGLLRMRARRTRG